MTLLGIYYLTVPDICTVFLGFICPISFELNNRQAGFIFSTLNYS